VRGTQVGVWTIGGFEARLDFFGCCVALLLIGARENLDIGFYFFDK